ncbi:MAG: hypothetical protein HYY28_12635 [Betaproteobacteria bacterium]|nr:hypothetical protein [Betaproteobacteria bacterium]
MKTIKDMPEHSGAREKQRGKGACALTDEELVAAILGMGTAGVDVRMIARQVAGLIGSSGPGRNVLAEHLRSENSRLVYDRFKRCLHLVR